MLDAFEIVTRSGIVLWRRHYARVSPAIVNALVAEVLIEHNKTRPRPSYTKYQYTLKWACANDVGLVFVAVYQSLLSLSWVDNLLNAAQALFVKDYADALTTPHTTHVDTRRFDVAFDRLVQKLDTGTTRHAPNEADSDAAAEVTPPSSSASNQDVSDALPPPPPPPPPQQFKKPAPSAKAPHPTSGDATSTDLTPVPTPDTSRPATPSQTSSHLLTAKAGPAKASRRARKAQHSLGPSAPVSSGDEASARKAKGAAKAKRRWDADGFAVDGDDDEVLDYSAPADESGVEERAVEGVNASQMGQRTGKGQFVLKDLDDEVDEILRGQKEKKTASITAEDEAGGLLNSATSRISGLFRNVVGGKTLSKADLQQPLQQMQNQLLEKNVAREAAERLTASVETDLLNHKTASFTSIDQTIRASMSKALTRILTPTSSLDLLRDVQSTIAPPHPRPYVISIVGVNGVGKSTNLGKIAYFLLQNHFRVLIVAGDTFRSGAVEQLRHHVRNLSELSRREGVGHVELFEKGYGKDAATVARDAVQYASKEMLFDVVLIDTAGRRHNDTRLMSSLTKFGQLANPDKIFMVGEALVGTDSVAQARNFAKEFVDSKGQLRNHGVGMDGFIISKCDTVGDMVGTLVSMVHATGIPVVFLGVGQHYGDLRGLNVGWAVDKLMK
ncbi:P-loop containing nucleoside triphosphate hydrolase protein [Teratosphaeria nubilosa]|uniref:Signal recognition particle receptor subunit alpha homolog n=1 Tax=Teratosphaeria nubilosa TaxID=161662 RepID=A0A6G1LM42_9PEZI|nr:P-loop containing nucleoside triphosphate hydrolase protein [Teratosphaeria nubilosa]